MPAEVGHIFRNGNGTEVVVVAYLDCIHELVSIIFIVAIHKEHSRQTRLLSILAIAIIARVL